MRCCFLFILLFGFVSSGPKSAWKKPVPKRLPVSSEPSGSWVSSSGNGQNRRNTARSFASSSASSSSNSGSSGGGFSSSSSSVSISSSGHSSVRITQSCFNDNCEVCIGRRCFQNVQYKAIKAFGNCPIAACHTSCIGFRMFTDGCPICECNGYATREPCKSHSECPSGSCQNSLCQYPALDPSLPMSCDYTYQCPPNEECRNSQCVPGQAPHWGSQTQPCFFISDCPSGFTCRGGTCFEEGRAHLQGSRCIFHHQCPSEYLCEKMTCYHTGVKHRMKPCVFHRQCRNNEKCMGMSCLPSGTVDHGKRRFGFGFTDRLFNDDNDGFFANN